MPINVCLAVPEFGYLLNNAGVGLILAGSRVERGVAISVTRGGFGHGGGRVLGGTIAKSPETGIAPGRKYFSGHFLHVGNYGAA